MSLSSVPSHDMAMEADNDGTYVEDMEEDMDTALDDNHDEGLVMHPEHPLMARVQAAYKDQLLRRLEQQRLELTVKEEELKKARKQREDIGVNLYGTQQQLARQQMLLEKSNDKYNVCKSIRMQCEAAAFASRKDFDAASVDIKSQDKLVESHRKELDKLNNTLLQIDKYNDETKAQIEVTKRATQKAKGNVASIETAKQRQDILVDELSNQVKQLNKSIALYTAQYEAQARETKATTDMVQEANSEIESVMFEKKQLVQQWKSSLLGMGRRDEAYAAVQASLQKQHELSRSIDNEILGYKQSIKKEQGKNETLTVLLNKLESEQVLLSRQLETIMQKSEKSKESYMMYSKSLRTTEDDLARALSEIKSHESASLALRRQLEVANVSIQNVEDQIMTKIQEKSMQNKYATQTVKTMRQLRENIRANEHELATKENELSRAVIQTSNVQSRIQKTQSQLNEVLSELKAKDTLIETYEAEIKSKNDIIQKRQGDADRCNKRFDELLSLTGGDVNYGPVEAEIHSLLKSIATKQADNVEAQQFWLRNQNLLVGLLREAEAEEGQISEARSQLTVLSQKRMRLDADIGSHQAETLEVQRSIATLQNDMIKLNNLIAKNTGARQELEEGNLLLANEFVSRLKEAEIESRGLEQNVIDVKDEKKRLLVELVEAERQIMLWEKKIQLAKETASTLDPEVGAGEIRSMRNEIHRMRLRLSQLEKVQEKMIKEMEKSVHRRESIAQRAGVTGSGATTTKNKGMTQMALRKRISELQKKLKQTAADASACDIDIRELHDSQIRVGQMVDEMTLQCRNLRVDENAMIQQVEQKSINKRNLLEDLLAMQRRVKHLAAVNSGKYRRIAKNEEMLEEELENEQRKLQLANQVIDEFNKQCPHLTQALAPISQMLARRLEDGDPGK